MPIYKLQTNLRCEACVASIKPLFDAEPGITSWSADVSVPEKWLTVQGNLIAKSRIEELLQSKGYRVIDTTPQLPEPKTSYYPLVLILVYLLLVCGMVEVALSGFDLMRVMRHFMAGFFLVFSFFKLLDVSAFAESYRMYDVVAKLWPGYGYVYPFIEFTLGLAYLADFQTQLTNIVTLVVMTVSSIGVLQSVLARKKIRCACLGSVFNLPMSYVTLIEDVLMVAMAGAMLAM